MVGLDTASGTIDAFLSAWQGFAASRPRLAGTATANLPVGGGAIIRQVRPVGGFVGGQSTGGGGFLKNVTGGNLLSKFGTQPTTQNTTTQNTGPLMQGRTSRLLTS